MSEGRKTGGRTKGTPNKATVERQQAAASALAEAQAAVLNGVDLSDIKDITGLQVMRLAMAAHIKAGNLDRAAAWGEKVAPYETAKPVAKTEVEDDRRVVVSGGLPDDRDNPPNVPSQAGRDIPESGAI